MSRISWNKNADENLLCVGDNFVILVTEFNGKWNESEMFEFITQS